MKKYLSLNTLAAFNFHINVELKKFR